VTKSDLIRVAVFEGKHIRKIMKEGGWWFSIIDIIEVLTGNDRPSKYCNNLKKLTSEGYVEVSEKIGQLKMLAPDGKMRLTDCCIVIGIPWELNR
jgi:DNA-damage-inducible protein D